MSQLNLAANLSWSAIERGPFVSEARDLLRRFTAQHECSLRTAMVPTPGFGPGEAMITPALDRRTRVLVRLAALIAVGASTESLRWAVELACATGADDEALAAVLAVTGAAAGSAQLVAVAPRLALALGSELRPGSPADLLLAEQARAGCTGDRL